MRVAVYQGESSVTDLVTRLYQIPQSGKLSRLLDLTPAETKAVVKRAEAALLEANPSLRNLTALPRGAVLVAPAVEGLQQTTAVAGLNAGEQAYLRAMAKDLAAAQKDLAAALGNQVKEAQATVSTLQSDAVKPLAPYLSPADLEAMKKRAAAEASAAEQLLKTQGQVSARLVKDLEDQAKAVS
jgi:hypothetical protein